MYFLIRPAFETDLSVLTEISFAAKDQAVCLNFTAIAFNYAISILDSTTNSDEITRDFTEAILCNALPLDLIGIVDTHAAPPLLTGTYELGYGGTVVLPDENFTKSS